MHFKCFEKSKTWEFGGFDTILTITCLLFEVKSCLFCPLPSGKRKTRFFRSTRNPRRKTKKNRFWNTFLTNFVRLLKRLIEVLFWPVCETFMPGFDECRGFGKKRCFSQLFPISHRKSVFFCKINPSKQSFSVRSKKFSKRRKYLEGSDAKNLVNLWPFHENLLRSRIYGWRQPFSVKAWKAILKSERHLSFVNGSVKKLQTLQFATIFYRVVWRKETTMPGWRGVVKICSSISNIYFLLCGLGQNAFFPSGHTQKIFFFVKVSVFETNVTWQLRNLKCEIVNVEYDIWI